MLLLISQFSSLENIGRLLSSVNWDKADLVVVNQCSKDFVYDLAHVLNVKESIPLSRSRNIALDYAKGALNMNSYTHIMFPDDDAYFLENFWQLYEDLDHNKSYVLNVLYGGDLFFRKVNSLNKWKNVMSSNLMVQNDIESKIFFREDLGVGTVNGSGEDIDFYWRYMSSASFIQTACISHPFGQNNAKSLSMLRHDKYFKGHIYLLTVHNKRYLLLLSFLRPIVDIMCLKNVRLNIEIIRRRLSILIND
jgi:hypothetical protein